MLFTYDELRARRNAEFYYLWGRCPDMDPPPKTEEIIDDDYEDEDPWDNFADDWETHA